MDSSFFPLLSPAWWNWYLLGVVFMLIELVVPKSIIVWFGVGALAAGFITELCGGLYWPIQIIIFVVLSALSLSSGRRIIKRTAPSKSKTLTRRLQTYLGRQAVLKAPIANGVGGIKLDGIALAVRGPNLPIGTIVEVIGVENSTLVVGKADTNL